MQFLPYLKDMPTELEQIQDIIDTFSLLDSWEEKYGFLIDLGEELPPLDPAERVEANRILGCQSNVWLIAVPEQRDGKEVIDFIAESDAKIVSGLVAILRRAYSGQTAEYIVNYDIHHLFEELDLEQHLTLGRRNGLASMVLRIQHLAEAVLNSSKNGENL